MPLVLPSIFEMVVALRVVRDLGARRAGRRAGLGAGSGSRPAVRPEGCIEDNRRDGWNLSASAPPTPGRTAGLEIWSGPSRGAGFESTSKFVEAVMYT